MLKRRLATVGSSALNETAVPQDLPHNTRAQSNAYHGYTSLESDDNLDALGGPLLLGTFSQRQQTYADRRPQMDVVARYSRGGESRRRYESRQQETRQTGATRQSQSGTTGGRGSEPQDLPRSSRTGSTANSWMTGTVGHKGIALGSCIGRLAAAVRLPGDEEEEKLLQFCVDSHQLHLGFTIYKKRDVRSHQSSAVTGCYCSKNQR